MVGSDSWINLPVGYNLVDHVNVSIHIRKILHDPANSFASTDRYLYHASGNSLLRLLPGLEQANTLR